MLPFPQSLIGKTGSPGTQPLSWKPDNPRGNGSWLATTRGEVVAWYNTYTDKSLWSHLGSTQGYWGNHQFSPDHLNSFTSSPGQLGRFQLTGSWQIWWSSKGRAGRRLWGTPGMSAWPQCQGQAWRRSPWVAKHWHSRGYQVIRTSRCGFMKDRFCLTNLTSL